MVQNQRNYFKSNAARPVEFRLEQLKKLKSLLLQHEDEMYKAIFNDFGKSKYENQLTEFFLLIDEINMAIKNLSKWVQPKSIKINSLYVLKNQEIRIIL